MTGRTEIVGRLVMSDRIAQGRIVVDDGVIVDLEAEDVTRAADDTGPFVAPGFVDLHVHGSGGHDAMGGRDALAGMARALLRRGVTSFLPTAVTAPLSALATFAGEVRAWVPTASSDGAEPLGFNLEGPFLAESRRGAHDSDQFVAPAALADGAIESLLDGLRVITIAPELPGAIELIERLAGSGVVVSLGHSAATYDEARRGYAAGARSTTHLFNAMSGLEHRGPGLALAALLDDAVAVELIADKFHVDEAMWPLVARLKPASRLLLVSDALAMAGTSARGGRVGGLAVEIDGERAVLAGTSTLAGSVIGLDTAVRNLAVALGALGLAVAAASTNPLELLGITDRGRLASGQRADLVELEDDLRLRRVMRGGAWLDA